MLGQTELKEKLHELLTELGTKELEIKKLKKEENRIHKEIRNIEKLLEG